jgi:four helix bundle protein
MHNFRKLNIWLDAIVLAKEVYQVTLNYPKEEKYGLISQINRRSVSVPSNIAEGSSRSSGKEFSYFIEVALDSLFELETQLILFNEFGMLASQDLDELIDKIIKLQKVLTKFLMNLEQK